MSQGINVITTIWTRLAAILCSAFLIGGLGAAPASAQVEVISGKFANGQLWRVATPSNWNGTLVLDLDAAPAINNNTAFVRWMTSNGYAYGGIDRTIVTYRYDQGAINLVMVRQEFINRYGKTPSRTIAYGVSRGSNVARHALQNHPDIFVGAATGMGAGAGLLSTMLCRLDSQFVLKTLVNPASPLKIVNVSNTAAAIAAEEAELANLINLANTTPLGRARLALAAAVSQTGPWLIANQPEPNPWDYDAQFAQLLQAYVDIQGVNIAAGATQIAGANILWNNGVNYRVELARSGRADFVKAMYGKAGVGLHLLEQDLRTLADAPRISAVPAAVNTAEKFLSYTGEIGGPIYSVNNIGDTNYPPAKEVAYYHTLRKAGNGHQHDDNWVRSAGHGNINATELLVAFNILIDRLNTGKWNYKSVEEQTALAEKLRSGAPTINLPASRFMQYHADEPLREWDGSNHNTYRPD